MQRRALLASVAAGAASLAGCSLGTGTTTDGPQDADGTGGGTETPTDAEPTPSGTPTPDGQSQSEETPTGPPARSERPEAPASVVELETAPLTYAFAPLSFRTDDEAEVALWFDRTATAEHPARLVGWIENANDFENTFQVRWIPAVGRTHSRTPRGYTHEARLHLAPTEQNALAETAPSLARTDDGSWRVEGIGPWMPETYRMEPGERRRLEYAVVGEPGTPDRPTGTYEFRGDDRTVTVTVWETNRPGPDGDSQFDGRSVPRLEREGQVGWYHDADRTTPAYLEPAAEQLALDGAVAFEMVNNSDETLRCGHWNLYKLVDGRWYHVAPKGHLSDCRGLVPGERIRWALRAFNGEPVPCGCGSSCRDGLTRGYLGGGTYAVVAGYGYDADGSGALLDVVGGAAPLEPTDDATVRRDGDVVTVTTEHYGDGEHPPDATFALTRADSAETRVLPEQVMASSTFGNRGQGLRNALAAMDGDVTRVVVRSDEHVVDRALGGDARERRLLFREQAYRVARDADG